MTYYEFGYFCFLWRLGKFHFSWIFKCMVVLNYTCMPFTYFVFIMNFSENKLCIHCPSRIEQCTKKHDNWMVCALTMLTVQKQILQDNFSFSIQRVLIDNCYTDCKNQPRCCNLIYNITMNQTCMWHLCR